MEPAVSLDAAGGLYRLKGGSWEGFDFNGEYAGFYPECRFTALAYENEMYWLAGVGSDGLPYLFLSLEGGSWENRPLTMYHPIHGGALRLSGEIFRILFDADRAQAFLVCRNGELAVAGDCPKCLRIRQLNCSAVRNAELRDGVLLVYPEGGGPPIRIALEEAAQYRVSPEFAEERLAEGGILVDLCSPEEFARHGRPGSVNLPIEGVALWLAAREKEKPLIFRCRLGVQADIAVRLARSLGFRRSWSLGRRTPGPPLPL